MSKKESAFFTEIQRVMVQLGFMFISIVQIDSDMSSQVFRDGRWRRTTRLFFGKQGKALVVMLQYDEEEGRYEANVTGSWSIRFGWKTLSPSKLYERYGNWITRPCGTSHRIENHEAELRRDIAFAGFKKEDAWVQEDPRPIEPKKLGKIVQTGIAPCLPFLDQQIGEMQWTDYVTDWPFPGSRKLFWQLFQKGTGLKERQAWQFFRSVVACPFGAGCPIERQTLKEQGNIAVGDILWRQVYHLSSIRVEPFEGLAVELEKSGNTQDDGFIHCRVRDLGDPYLNGHYRWVLGPSKKGLLVKVPKDAWYDAEGRRKEDVDLLCLRVTKVHSFSVVAEPFWVRGSAVKRIKRIHATKKFTMTEGGKTIIEIDLAR